MPELCHALFRVTAAHPHMTLISRRNQSSCYQKMKAVFSLAGTFWRLLCAEPDIAIPRCCSCACVVSIGHYRYGVDTAGFLAEYAPVVFPHVAALTFPLTGPAGAGLYCYHAGIASVSIGPVGADWLIVGPHVIESAR